MKHPADGAELTEPPETAAGPAFFSESGRLKTMKMIQYFLGDSTNVAFCETRMANFSGIHAGIFSWSPQELLMAISSVRAL